MKSPQILELSGIGRKDVLDKIGVPVKVNLPGVGENAQEHLVCAISLGELLVSRMNFVKHLTRPVQS